MESEPEAEEEVEAPTTNRSVPGVGDLAEHLGASNWRRLPSVGDGPQARASAGVFFHNGSDGRRRSCAIHPVASMISRSYDGLRRDSRGIALAR